MFKVISNFEFRISQILGVTNLLFDGGSLSKTLVHSNSEFIQILGVTNLIFDRSSCHQTIVKFLISYQNKSDGSQTSIGHPFLFIYWKLRTIVKQLNVYFVN